MDLQNLTLEARLASLFIGYTIVNLLLTHRRFERGLIREMQPLLDFCCFAFALWSYVVPKIQTAVTWVRATSIVCFSLMSFLLLMLIVQSQFFNFGLAEEEPRRLVRYLRLGQKIFVAIVCGLLAWELCLPAQGSLAPTA